MLLADAHVPDSIRTSFGVHYLERASSAIESLKWLQNLAKSTSTWPFSNTAMVVSATSERSVNEEEPNQSATQVQLPIRLLGVSCKRSRCNTNNEKRKMRRERAKRKRPKK